MLIPSLERCIARAERSRAADTTDALRELQVGPVLVEGCDVALAGGERVVQVPIEGELRAGLCEHERPQQLAVAGSFLQHLVPGREGPQATY